MRGTRWLPGFAVLVSLGVATTLAATVATAMPQARADTFSDPVGDSQGAPDVTAVAISGDAATGTIQVRVTVTGFQPATRDGLERNVDVWLDTDGNRATGDPEDGTEYGLVAWNDPAGSFWDVGRWNGSDWGSAPESSTMSFSRSGDVLTWTVNKSDLGGATSFSFYVHACTWDTAAESHVGVEEAPDSGWWNYQLSATAPATPPARTVELKILSTKTTPRVAVAGKRFTVDFFAVFEEETTATKIDIGTGGTTTGPMVILRFASGGKMVCDPSVQGKVIAHAESFKGATARLSFLIPKTAKGKLLKVKVKLTAKDSGSGGSGKTLTAGKVVTFRVK
jgi:hypothetical protein